eukprot:6702067-Prymnesium_polylepis.1
MLSDAHISMRIQNTAAPSRDPAPAVHVSPALCVCSVTPVSSPPKIPQPPSGPPYKLASHGHVRRALQERCVGSHSSVSPPLRAPALPASTARLDAAGRRRQSGRLNNPGLRESSAQPLTRGRRCRGCPCQPATGRCPWRPRQPASPTATKARRAV